MIDGITPFMPLSHSHLKRALQIHMQTSNIENNNFHTSDHTMQYLLSSAFIEYLTLHHNNNDNKEEASTTSTTITPESISMPNKMNAAECALNSWDGIIRIIKRFK